MYILSQLSEKHGLNRIKNTYSCCTSQTNVCTVLVEDICLQISTNAEAMLARMEQRVQTPCTRTLVAVSLVTRERTARQVRPLKCL